MTDLTLQDHGTIFLLRARTKAGTRWVLENVQVQNEYAGAIVVEPRYVDALADGAVADGLSVEVS